MGGEGSGRRPDPLNLLKSKPFVSYTGDELIIPNLSGVKESALNTAGDHTISGAKYIPEIIFGTVSGSHTASNYPQGTLMFIYTP